MSEQELYHYGVVGMKWGVRKNPAKAYAKSKRELEKRTTRYNRANERSTAARQNLKNKGKKLYEITERAGDLSKKEADAMDAYINLSMRDRKSIPLLERKAYDKAVDNANTKAFRAHQAVLDNQMAEVKIRDEIGKDNIRTKRLERRTARAQRRAEHFQRVMDKTFSQVDQETIARGQALFDEKYKKR